VSKMLTDAFGLTVTNGWYRDDQRRSQAARPVYQELIEVIRQCSIVDSDEIGWRIDALSILLCVFGNLVAYGSGVSIAD
jgi:hypothetical protein